MKKIYLILTVLFAVFFSANAQELAGYKLCIDPGHGGHDAANDREIFLPYNIVYWESEGDLEVAQDLEILLKDLGADVQLTRTANDDSDDISLSSRVAIANNYGADYFQSIHTNAANTVVNYTLVLYHGYTDNPTYAAAKTLSNVMGTEIHKVMKTTHTNVAGDYTFYGNTSGLGVIRGTNMPASLAEGSFHDVPLEGLRLKSSHYLENYAWAVAKSFMILYDKAGFTKGRVGGIISDDASHEAMNGVQVTVAGSSESCLVDDYYNGIYALDLDPGTYTLTLTKEGYVSKDVNVTITANTYTDLDIELMYLNEGKPRADFVVSGLPAGAGKEITFNASNSVDPDGTISSYAWSFDDGGSGSGQSINHTFVADGDYNVTLTVTDNDSKTGSITKLIQIATNPPANPTLLSVTNEGDNVKVTWAQNIESEATYRIYASNSDALDNFSVLVDEATLTAGTTEHTIVSPALNANGYHFKMTAINPGGESGFSDTYSKISTNDPTNFKSVLVVDGFDRIQSTGSFHETTHTFSTTYMSTLRDAGDVIVSSAANEAVVNGTVNLINYDIVVWFVGDESTEDETFSVAEQAKVKGFLENGGNLLVTGSEIGWDLSHKGTADDKAFYNNYLKANYVNDGEKLNNPATGISGSAFEGVTLNFGQVYEEDWPDEISAASGGENILSFKNGGKSGVVYTGTFGTSSVEASVIHISFPIETVSDKAAITTFMEKVLAYFAETPNAIYDIENTANVNLYPVPVGEKLSVEFNVNIQSTTNISIFDFSGKKVFTTVFEKINQANTYKIDVSNLNNGLYILKAQGKEINFSKKFVKE